MTTVLSIEGNIGSGKSTIINFLKEKYKNSSDFIFLPEPVDQWEQIKDKDNNTILSKFYNDQKKYSFAFQMMAYISRLELLRKAIQENPSKIIITERSLFTDKFVFAQMLYDDHKMEEIEYQIYNKWFHSFIDLAPLHKLIYLKTDPEISFKRIIKRNRDGENGIPFDYIKNCHSYHNHMYEVMDCQKKIIDCTNDFNQDDSYFELINKQIFELF
jgi:deoxyadenosine/deoxycytidine kinase